MYISGNTEDADEGGFFIGKLDNNFVNGGPLPDLNGHTVGQM